MTAAAAPAIILATRRTAKNLRGRHSSFIVNSSIYYDNLHHTIPTIRWSSVVPTATFATRNVSETLLYTAFNTKKTYLSSTTVVSGRSRKRPRPGRRQRQQNDSAPSIGGGKTNVRGNIGVEKTSISSSKVKATSESIYNDNDEENDLSSPYPKGKPWRVLWPRPHGEPKTPGSSLLDFHKRIPTIEQLRRAWSNYKETWEDGITGIPTRHKDKTKENGDGLKGDTVSSIGSSTITQEQLQKISDNAGNNLKIARKDAQDLLEHTKETTGIHTQDDIKALASEAMKIATECIREFMAGYRKRRDSEIDKMLHEYFQEENEKTDVEDEFLRGKSRGKFKNKKNRDGDKITSTGTISSTSGSIVRKKKRKPKRGIPRT